MKAQIQWGQKYSALSPGTLLPSWDLTGASGMLYMS